jgi:hypothetical protein
MASQMLKRGSSIVCCPEETMTEQRFVSQQFLCLLCFISCLSCTATSHHSHTNMKILTRNAIHIAPDHSLIAIRQVEQNPIKMPYTALQTLGYLARCSNWERIYNVNRAPHRRAKTTACKFYAHRGKYKKSGRKVLVLKRTGPRKIDCGCGGCCICGRFIGEL